MGSGAITIKKVLRTVFYFCLYRAIVPGSPTTETHSTAAIIINAKRKEPAHDPKNTKIHFFFSFRLCNITLDVSSLSLCSACILSGNAHEFRVWGLKIAILKLKIEKRAKKYFGF